MLPGDDELVAQAQSGDMGAFALLLERHRGAIVHFLRRFVPSADDVQDLAQETFVSAFQHLQTLRDPASFGAWLRGIALNAARQWWRHEKHLSLDSLWNEPSAAWCTGHHPEEAATAWLRRTVKDALAALPPEPRSAVLLHYFNGYEYGETAALLQVPISTVRGRLSLARRRLREEMGELARPQNSSKQPAPAAAEYELTANDIAALRGAAMLASQDPARAILQTICMEPDGTLVSTDVHRLFVNRGSSIRPPARVLVRSALFAGLRDRVGLSRAWLSLSKNEAIFRFIDEQDTSSEHVSRAPLVTDEPYARYERITPAAWEKVARLSVRDLLAALEEVGRFQSFLMASAIPDRGLPECKIVLTFVGGQSSLILHDGAGKGEPMPTHWTMHTELPAAIEGLEPGREFTIALNRLYLRECLQALSVVSSQSLEMRLNEPQSPILMQPDGPQNSYVLLMPMQLQLSEHLRLRSTT